MHPLLIRQLADQTFIRNDDTTADAKHELITAMEGAIEEYHDIYKKYERRVRSGRMAYLSRKCASLIASAISGREAWDRYTYTHRTIQTLFRAHGMYVTAWEAASIGRRLYNENREITERTATGRYTIRGVHEWVQKYGEP